MNMDSGQYAIKLDDPSGRQLPLHNSLPARKTAVVGRMTAAEFQVPPNAQTGPAVAMTGLENSS
jgi:hypothetical protein